MAEILFLNLVVASQPVPGEASMKGFKQQIELSAISWGAKADHKEKEGDPETILTTTSPQQLKLTKAFDRSTTLLCRYMDKRTPFDSATITMLSATVWGPEKKHLPLLQIRLQDGYVEDLNLQVAESGKSMGVKETVSLSFRKIHVEYYPGDLSKGRSSPTIFDLVANSVGLSD